MLWFQLPKAHLRQLFEHVVQTERTRPGPCSFRVILGRRDAGEAHDLAAAAAHGFLVGGADPPPVVVASVDIRDSVHQPERFARVRQAEAHGCEEDCRRQGAAA